MMTSEKRMEKKIEKMSAIANQLKSFSLKEMQQAMNLKSVWNLLCIMEKRGIIILDSEGETREWNLTNTARGMELVKAHNDLIASLKA